MLLFDCQIEFNSYISVSESSLQIGQLLQERFFKITSVLHAEVQPDTGKMLIVGGEGPVNMGPGQFIKVQFGPSILLNFKLLLKLATWLARIIAPILR